MSGLEIRIGATEREGEAGGRLGLAHDLEKGKERRKRKMRGFAALRV